jgi:post-segregation antitoxin (ccd killing protein)
MSAPRPKVKASATRITVNLLDARTRAILEREAKAAGVSLSRAAERALARGLRTAVVDPEDWLLALERKLADHMRLTARDLAIGQELTIGLARALYRRLPSEPLDLASGQAEAAEIEVQKLLDDAAGHLIRGRDATSAHAVEEG